MPLYFPLFFICTTFLCVFVYFILLVLSPIRSFLTCLYIFQRIHSSFFFYLINILHSLFPFLLSKKEKPFQYNAKLFPLIIKSKHISNLLAKCNYFIPYCYLIIDFRPERKRWTAIYTYFLFQIFKLFQNENRRTSAPMWFLTWAIGLQLLMLTWIVLLSSDGYSIHNWFVAFCKKKKKNHISTNGSPLIFDDRQYTQALRWAYH